MTHFDDGHCVNISNALLHGLSMNQTKENESSVSEASSSQSTSNHDDLILLGHVFNEKVKAAAIFLPRCNDKENKKKCHSSNQLVHNPDQSGIRRLQDDPKESDEWWHLLQKKTIKDPDSHDGMALFH